MTHFRNECKNQSNFEFKVGNQNVEYTSVNGYLGVHINEHLDFFVLQIPYPKQMGELCPVISKIQNYRDVGYKTYSNYITRVLYLL